MTPSSEWAVFAGFFLSLVHSAACRDSVQAGLRRAAVVHTAVFLVGAWLSLMLLAVAGSPWAAAVMGFSLILIVRLLDAAKRKTLIEPVLAEDLWLVGQMMKFPGFYFPFLTAFQKASLAGGVLGVVLGVWLCAPLPGVRLVCLVALAFLTGGFVLSCRTNPGRRFWRRLFIDHPAGCDANWDVAEYGLLGCGLLHVARLLVDREETTALLAPERTGLSPLCVWRDRGELSPCVTSPHVVLVQAESYVNLRRLHAGVGSGWTRHFDRLAAEGRSGLLETGTFGAYTVRTEFSVLTGVNRSDLGVYGVNPYLLARKAPVGSLARRFAAMGYFTVFMHPYSLRFFDRRRVMPQLGFACLIGGEAFAGAERNGRYVSDRAVGARIRDALAAADRPVFVFAVTLAAHGPWGLETAGAGMDSPEASPLPEDVRNCAGFPEYARRLRDTDVFLGELADAMDGLNRPSTLAFYGDHPGHLCTKISETATATDYLIWNSKGRSVPTKSASDSTVRPEHFGGMILENCLVDSME